MAQKPMMICLALLCGCGGGGGGGTGSGIDPRLARLDIYEAQKLRVLGDPGAGVMAMPATSPANLPVTGTLDFAGGATIRVEHPTRALVLYGDASVVVDFDQGAATGALDGFFGNNAAGQIVDYSGAIGLDGTTAGADLSLGYAGTLSTAGETLVFGGDMQGIFLGNPVGAITAAALEALVLRNGVNADATVIVIAESAGAP